MRVLTITAIAFLAISLHGCTERIQRSAAKVRAFDISLYAQRGPVAVTLTTGEEMSADYFNMVGDSALWLDPVTGRSVAVPISSVQRITIRDRASGALIGLGAGITIGAGIAGFREGAWESDRMFSSGGMLIVGGELLGGVLGAIIGKPQHFDFVGDPSTR